MSYFLIRLGLTRVNSESNELQNIYVNKVSVKNRQLNSNFRNIIAIFSCWDYGDREICLTAINPAKTQKQSSGGVL